LLSIPGSVVVLAAAPIALPVRVLVRA